MFDVIFFSLTFLALIGLIIGLIKPDKVIRWGEKKTRKQVALIYGTAIIIFFILFAIAISSPEKRGEIKPEITQPIQEQLAQPEIKEESEIISKKIVFDIPLFITKSFSEIKSILGAPNKSRLPTDFDTGWAEWHKENITLSINFDRNGRLVNELGYAMSIFPTKFSVVISESELRQLGNLVNENYPFEITKELTKNGKVWALNILLPETKTDSQTYSTIIDKIETYKLPVKSGKWQTCIVNQINSLSNVGLLQFQYWLLSLSSNPMMDEIEITVAIARKLGCPEPIVKTIPEKIEVLKTWQGTGSKNLGSYTPDTDNYVMKITWQNSPFNEDFGNDEFAIDRRLLFDYGIVDYEEGASITGSPLISAFYYPSGSEERPSNYLGYTHFDILRVKAPDQATWKVEIYKIIEPAKTYIE